MWKPSEQQSAQIAQEYVRIGIAKGERLPLPRGLDSASDYLAFLHQVPDGSGVSGIPAAMARPAASR